MFYLGDVICVTTVFVKFFHLSLEGPIEVKDILISFDQWPGRNIALDHIAISFARIKVNMSISFLDKLISKVTD